MFQQVKRPSLRRLLNASSLALVCTALPAPQLASACGGGVFSSGVVAADVQRIVLSVRAGGERTDVITQIEVGDARTDYGLLIPLPSEPTLQSEACGQLGARAARHAHPGAGHSCALGWRGRLWLLGR